MKGSSRYGAASIALLAVLTLVFVWPSTVMACGDYDCNGITNIGDLSTAISYLFVSGPFTTCAAGVTPGADCDGNFLYTFHDLILLIDNQTAGAPLFCPNSGPQWRPPLGDDTVLHDKSIMLGGATSWTIPINLRSDYLVDAALLPIRIRVGGLLTPATFGTISAPGWSAFTSALLPGRILFMRDRNVGLIGGGCAGNPIATVEITGPFSVTDQTITVDFLAWPPNEAGFDVNYEMLIGTYPTRMGRTPGIRSCCVGVTGNVNCIGIVDLADLSALISYLIGSGYVIQCWDEANVNRAGLVDLSDLSVLVSYLTGGGFALPPCP